MSNKYFGIKDAGGMGTALAKLADKYPLLFLTERDFYPATVAYISDYYANLTSEYRVSGGKVDFRIGGTNPTQLEIAVQPRELLDPNNPKLHFPGHAQQTALHPSANKSELEKLKADVVSRSRILLLIDLTGKYSWESLTASYIKHASTMQGGVVSVVYATSGGAWYFNI